MFNWITTFVEQGGYPAIALLMFAENVFPPIPSELIMPLAGFTAAHGDLHIVPVVLAGSAGSLLGAPLWYLMARWLGSERLKRWAARHGHWLTLTPGEVDRACRWFTRHGRVAVLVGRLVPAVRTLISVPAGFARMALLPFLVFSALGTVLWTAALAVAGYLLEGSYQHVAGWLDPVSNVIALGLVAWYGLRVIRQRRRR